MRKIGLISDSIEHAPCYWNVLDDGALFRCGECDELGHARDMLFTLTPDGTRLLAHKGCLCQDWLANAKDMKGFV